MPEDPEMFIAALVAVQGWKDEQQFQIDNALKEIANVQKQNDSGVASGKVTPSQYNNLNKQIAMYTDAQSERDYELHVFLPNHSWDFLTRAFGNATIHYDAYAPKRGEWDLAFRFDPERAKAIGTCSQRHATDAFGMLVGSGGAGSLPALDKAEIDEGSSIDVLLMEFPESDKIMEFLKTNKPEMNVYFMWKKHPLSFQTIGHSEMVVGPRSATTYLACSLSKRVVELYPDTDYKRWLSKWENPNYQMVYGKEFPAALVWRAMETLWDRPHSIRTVLGRESRMRMVPRTSAAGLAVGQSPERGVL